MRKVDQSKVVIDGLCLDGTKHKLYCGETQDNKLVCLRCSSKFKFTGQSKDGRRIYKKIGHCVIEKNARIYAMTW